SPVAIAVKWQAEVFQLIDNLGRFATHELDRILVTQIIRTLDGIEHMPIPVVLGHIPQRSTDPALCGYRMRTRWKYLGQDRHIQSGLRQLQCGAHAGTAGANNHRIEMTGGDSSFDCSQVMLSRVSE